MHPTGKPSMKYWTQSFSDTCSSYLVQRRSGQTLRSPFARLGVPRVVERRGVRVLGEADERPIRLTVDDLELLVPHLEVRRAALAVRRCRAVGRRPVDTRASAVRRPIGDLVDLADHRLASEVLPGPREAFVQQH